METAVVDSSETNNVGVPLPDLPPKEGVEEGVPETVSSSEVGKNANSEKELSWEKIAAEISTDVENETVSEVCEAEAIGPPEEETVINSVTEEATVTESETHEVVADSTEQQTVIETPTVIEETDAITEIKEADVETTTEIAQPIAEEVALPVEEEVHEFDKSSEVLPVDEVVEETVTEVVEEAVTEVVETPETEEHVAMEVQEPPEVVDAPPEFSPEKSNEVEISELKSDEAPPEPAEEIEYTVLESEEVETNEIIEEHLAQTKTLTETVVIINPDQSQTELTIEQMEEDERNDDSSQDYTEEIYLVTKESEGVDDPPKQEAQDSPKPKKQRGRKPIADIPLHVLGRDISKPTEGVSNGGRTMPKPRLGVKVPYRNLTSQIVSKQEIEKEIMDRFKLKQEQNLTNSGDLLFARKLTQRLAKKLIPSEKDKSSAKLETVEASSSVMLTSDIKNNSDLIAILEGEGDEIQLSNQKQTVEEKQEVVKKTEREIALEQLKELPGKPTKAIKTKVEDEKKFTIPQKETKPAPSLIPQKTPVVKKQVDVEPRLKTGMVIKTYTRKRKSTELEPTLPPKKAIVATPIKTEDGSPSNVYITKSSRVIKRKVIWDPDEVPTKSPIRSPKIEPGKASPAKTVDKKDTPKTIEKKEPTKTTEKKEVTKTAEKKEVTKTVEKKEVAKTAEKKEPVKTTEKKEAPEKSPEKKMATPLKKIISKSPPPKRPKRLTEVDKLLMDEGAVNMLYDVKTNDDATPEKLKKKTNKNVISLDRAHKELMSKTNVIKNDLQQNTNKDVQKSLRKKEIVSPTSKKEVKMETTPTPPVTRKKSKDSVRSSVHSPPSSPAYNAAEASRIIRRHSSSSFSSNDELSDEDGEEKSSKKKGNVESPRKKMKKSGDAKPKEASKNNNNTVTEAKANNVDKGAGQYKSFTTTRKNKLVSIKLQSVNGKCYLNEQVLKELTLCLKEYGKDDDCHVMAITSDNNESFCEGLDYRLLVVEDEAARKKKATELASLLKEFLRCLLNFPKVLVAGIQGDCVGVAVTMLPLFDMVIASDTSTFSAPYAKLGCIPEAGFLLSVPHLSSNGLASELLYASQTIKADDAFRRGLVSRLCWPEKYQQELKSLVAQVANQSRQSIIATKQQLRQNVLQITESALSSVSKVLVEYWTTPECQKNFAK